MFLRSSMVRWNVWSRSILDDELSKRSVWRISTHRSILHGENQDEQHESLSDWFHWHVDQVIRSISSNGTNSIVSNNGQWTTVHSTPFPRDVRDPFDEQIEFHSESGILLSISIGSWQTRPGIDGDQQSLHRSDDLFPYQSNPHVCGDEIPSADARWVQCEAFIVRTEWDFQRTCERYSIDRHRLESVSSEA